MNCCHFPDVDISATRPKRAPLNKALKTSMPSVGSIGGPIKRFKPWEGALKSTSSSNVYFLSASSAALSWTDPMTELYDWHFPCLWSASGYRSNTSWTTLDRIWRGLRFNSWCVAATTVMKPLSLKRGWTQWDNRLNQRWGKKSLEILWVVWAQPWQRSPLLVCMCPWRSFSVLSTWIQHKVRKDKSTWKGK